MEIPSARLEDAQPAFRGGRTEALACAPVDPVRSGLRRGRGSRNACKRIRQ